jgi:flagellar biosynthesis protein FliQ
MEVVVHQVGALFILCPWMVGVMLNHTRDAMQKA